MALSALLETFVLDVDGSMGFAFTTSVNLSSASYAALALPSLTFDMRYSGTFASTRGLTASCTPIVLDSGTDAIMRPMAA